VTCGARRTALRALTAALLAAVTAVLVLAGCGIAADDSAREIPRDALPETLQNETTSTTSPSGTTRNESLFLVRSGTPEGVETLDRVFASIDAPQDPADLPAAVVRALVDARPDVLQRSDLINAVPPGLEVLRSERVGDGVLELDLDDLDTVEGSLQRLAVAQLVFTLTELEGITAVRFFEDGQPVAVPIEQGTSPAGTPVRRTDDPSLLAALRAPSTTTTTER
jgi:hypothetical protein